MIKLKDKNKRFLKNTFFILILLLLFFMYKNSVFDSVFTCDYDYCYICNDNVVKDNGVLSFERGIDNKPLILVDHNSCKELKSGESFRIGSYNTYLTYLFLISSTFLLILGLVILFLL